MLSGLAAPAYAQQPAQAPATAPVAPAQPGVGTGTVQSISIAGNQRIETETVLSYMGLRVGEPYDQERLDQVLRDLFATELFADVAIAGADTGNIVVQVRENPVINRIVLEGNRRIKDDKILPEIRLSPRQIFTRSRARADVARIVELYRRQGRFAAQVEPKIVQLDQNRVDVVFEIEEGPRSRVRQINIIGNERFSDAQLRSEMATRQARFYRFFSSADSYDPDRLAFDQQKLRQFYLTQGYADFRVVSAVAELTPDRRDFIITYVIEEGERYRFGEVGVESALRDFRGEDLQAALPMRSGQWYNARQVEDTVTSLSETAGLLGYAFADVRPQFNRNRETLTMDVSFRIAEAPRVYVERIDITGNTNTRDNVIRREFRLAEGDPFNAVRVRRSRDRIQSLGFFQDNLEIQQQPGSAPDRVVLAVELEERSTGELQLSAGFSSLERFLVNAQIRQRNFMGKGQELRAGINYSSYAKSVELGFTEPYLFGRNIALGGDVYRRDINSFNFLETRRRTTFQQITTGGQIRAGVPLTEHLTVALRYGLNYDQVRLAQDVFFTRDPATGQLVCDPLVAGRYLCQAIGNRVNSSAGYSLVYDTLNNRLRPTAGERAVFSQDFAGIGGDVRYLRTRANGSKFWGVGRGFVFSLSLEGGYIHSFETAPAPDQDPVRLIDRFFLGEPQIRGFDIRGVGPRIQRVPYLFDTAPDGSFTNVRLSEDRNQIIDDALGGRAYYLGRAELEIPLGSGARDLGVRPSVFLDVGALFGVRRPATLDLPPGSPELVRPILNADGLRQCLGANSAVTALPATEASCPTGTTLIANNIPPFRERFVGDTPKPRVSVGFGINWNSPFGPFRIDIAKALISAEGDDTKLFTFNVGTAF
ncbi:MAG: outer membrane protein assembly factor BamA [Allosphingosinicella sp.]|uniref:outer membrane protein assembly factor BamA n=1 Tax=Allosphingosinicella sp. TaxID=2823234 RepID=UPI0039300E06